MMQLTLKQQEKAAKEFAKKWENKGDEKQDTQRFWMELLQTVYGVENPADIICFEERVQLEHTSYIDAMIPATHTLIEQKSLGKDLHAPIRQSDGTELTPVEQAKRYAANLSYSKRARWIVSCNFKEFHVLDMERPNDSVEIIELKQLGTDFYRLNFLVDVKSSHIEREMEISKGAGELVGRLYDCLLQQYKINALLTETEILHNINKLCVKLVFCLYAEDSGLFGKKNIFHDYLKDFQPHQVRNALMDLFRILDTPESNRSPYETESLLAFPYVNGSLFSDAVEIPQFSEEAIQLILQDACNFDWSEISPTIFGAIFESTLNPETRRHGGMHYTSIENIHKLIDPLFLDAFKNEYKEAMTLKTGKARMKALKQLQESMSSKTFFDPAAGSGNFLTESYLSLRRLENDILRETITDAAGTGVLGFDEEEFNPIKVSIQQFYGIEINDFAVSVAKTAIWIAEAQMFKETEAIIHKEMDFLPLHTNANIHEGNSLQMDWETVIPAAELTYIMGNPPFLGFTYMNEFQKQDLQLLFPKKKNLDYVCCWYKKAYEYMKDTEVECAFVSTNSIVQGETVARMWEDIPVCINFAHRSFIWSSESKNSANVHCVIIGFSMEGNGDKWLFDDGKSLKVESINKYLMDGPDILIQSRNKPLSNVNPMAYGNKPVDGGNLIIEADEYPQICENYPDIVKYIHPLVGAKEYLYNEERYCLWLKGVDPSIIKNNPFLYDRVSKCKEVRTNSKAAGIRKFADVPAIFAQITQPEDCNYLIIPCTSSEKRRYIPIGFMDGNIKVTNAVQIVPNATLYDFGIITSNVHMAWMRAFAGRLKSDYRYSKDVIYNTFPWPKLQEQHRVAIEKTAKQILEARKLYPNSTLAELYDEVTMPIELREAHRDNNRAVMRAYGFDLKMTEEECVAELMKLYQALLEK
ncbi:DNA methyltransferase [Veillonella sp. VA139]|uniref:DNA methyltransferase n=1 Tax=Veillonella sp. VA139 TaxID=741830 RepID=UPI001F0CB5D0|nr:DNA methyltransferase [Veillonella sp. VA139]